MKSTENLKKYFDYYAENCYSIEKLKDNPFQISASLLKIKAKNYISSLFNEEITLRQIKMEKPNFLLKELESKDLYVIYRTKEEKNYVSKYCYETVVHKNQDRIHNLSDKLGCSPEKIKNLAAFYAINILKLTQEEFQKEIELGRAKTQKKISDNYWHNFENNTKQILDHLENLEEEKEIIEYLNEIEKNRNINFLYERVTNHAMLYHQERKDELIKNLKKKIDIYRKWKTNKNKKRLEEKKQNLLEEKRKRALTCIKKFLKTKSLTTKEEFIKKENITTKEFDDYLELILEIDQELYENCKKKLEQNSLHFFLIQKAKINAISDYLKYGIKDEDTIREFDVLDFHLLYKFDFKEADKIAKTTLNQEDYKRFKIFINQNAKASSITIKQIMEERKYINIKKDENGEIMKDSGTLMTEFEKKEIIDFLNENNIPINAKTYKLACNRYLKKELKKEKLILAKKSV